MPKNKFKLDDFYFDLPPQLIAQYPNEKRDESKLFQINRVSGEFSHHNFNDLPSILQKGDLLVLNNAKVLNARIFFKRKSGAGLELVLISKDDDNLWQAITNRTKKLQIGETISSIKDPSVTFKILSRIDDHLEIEPNVELTDEVLSSIGQIPLPPYIKRSPENVDNSRYQTVFATERGAVAAPTAGLHFTDDLLNSLKEKGIGIEFLTLFVSWGTFIPIRERDITKHKMHVEKYYLPDKTADKINNARKDGRRIIAVGTTSLRVLESTFNNNTNISGYGETDLFIYPPHEVKSVSGLITNFHTPHSSLLMLVSAFSGYETIMNAYKEAINMEYRFFSYGDAMIIL
ncbi:tRNA preQ1(34) S-adenosylmethionine ribosyltransferase-isomerase QueA [Spirochaetota bacterium]